VRCFAAATPAVARQLGARHLKHLATAASEVISEALANRSSKAVAELADHPLEHPRSEVRSGLQAAGDAPRAEGFRCLA
jgi:hypothetical protein